MAATKKDIERWLNGSLENGDSHMLVMVDTFDYEDYPVGVGTAEECLDKYNNPPRMQQVMEVYDLSMSIEDQLNEHRAFHLPEEK